jgi:hypothetical protein
MYFLWVFGLLAVGLLIFSLIQWGRGKLETGNFAQVSSALIAVIGFAGLIYQIQLNRERATQEALRAETAEARKVYMSYSEALLRYPELSAPNYDSLMHNHREYLRYKNFVAHMVWAYDEILTAVAQDGPLEDAGGWLVAFEIDIHDHQRYLCHLEKTEPKFFEMYGAKVRERLHAIDRASCTGEEPLREVNPGPETVGPG